MLRQRGVTLMELMVAAAVLGIVVAAGAPALTTMVRDSRVRAAAEAWRDGLAQARIEAIRRNQRVQFSADGVGFELAAIDADGDAELLLAWQGAELGEAVDVELLDDAQAAFDGSGQLSPAGTPFRARFRPSSGTCLADEGDALCLGLEAVNGFAKVCDPAQPEGQPRACELGD